MLLDRFFSVKKISRLNNNNSYRRILIGKRRRASSRTRLAVRTEVALRLGILYGYCRVDTLMIPIFTIFITVLLLHYLASIIMISLLLLMNFVIPSGVREP